MQQGYRSSLNLDLIDLKLGFRYLVERIRAVRAAGFRNVNIYLVCAVAQLFYPRHSSLVRGKMKLSALEICCIVLASVVAVAGFVGAASALISAV